MNTSIRDSPPLSLFLCGVQYFLLLFYGGLSVNTNVNSIDHSVQFKLPVTFIGTIIDVEMAKSSNSVLISALIRIFEVGFFWSS